jgi:phosphohistidine swiveling domain-containing protein
MNDKFEPKLFQVRSLTGTQKWDCKKLKKFNALTDSTRNKLNIALKTAPGIFGASNLFGQMPDWNPTEMIGRVPRKLAFSLEELITNGPWLDGRSQMGYHRPYSSKLMLSFAGQPYIDVRLSFNSFLPSGIPPKIGEKLVNSWLSKLNESPQYHDKVEFEIVTTCYDFDFDGKANKLLGSVLDKEELYDFKIRLKDLTYPLLRGEGDASIKKCLDKIRELEAKQNRATFLDTSLNDLIQDCITLGTIPFAMLARHGFIASSILDSLKRLEIIDDSDVSAFHASTETVASKLVQDMGKLADSVVEMKKFINKYGHLRPGTYDILSPRYSELSLEELSLSTDRSSLKKQNPFYLNSNQEKKIDQLLEKEGCTDFPAVGLIDYLRQAIEGREYGKFVFTRSVSAILESIANWGKALGVSKEILSHLSISEVRNFQKEVSSDLQRNLECLKKVAASNQEHWNLCRSTRLPQLLTDSNGVDVVPFQVSQPNFISSKKITGEVMFLDAGFTSDQITGKVILIENADPGFDWIFSQEIIALITKYGGANSHMAIRCAEFGIPAAIGCGEQRFEAMKKAQSISLDCSSRVLTPLFQKHKK